MRLTAFLQNAKKLGDVSKKYSNFPDSYVKRSMEQVYWTTPKGEESRRGKAEKNQSGNAKLSFTGKPQYLDKTIERKKFRFTTNRPWTAQFYQQNMPGTIRKKVFVEPIREFRSLFL
jgi:large subunit ribosomal protein L24